MAILEEYAVEEALDLSQDRLGYNDNKQATGWKAQRVIRFPVQERKFHLLQSVQIDSMAPSAASQGVQEDNSVAVKRTGREAVVCCPV